tara:strand:- start:3786 stop:5759 length:1974 start_codon:yes stop_codon:yes gene_type:complete
MDREQANKEFIGLKPLLLTAIALTTMFTSSLSQARSTEPLSYAAKQAIDTNPQVKQRWHEFKASMHGVDAAFSGYLPKVDVNASTGYETRNYGVDDDYARNTAELSVTQMLYDGFRTSNEVERFEQIQLTRYFELLAQAQQTSLEAATAYLDVIRYNKLVELAEQNLEQHQMVFQQIEQSVGAGVARAADLEQITGRLSLAESNVMTELANLHDVNARYLRIVGELPPSNLNEAGVDDEQIPFSINKALALAYENSPRFYATLYGISAEQAFAQSQKSGFHPNVNLSARYGMQDRDELGFNTTRSEGRIGIDVSYNLFNGGLDSANLEQAYEQVNVAKQQRDLACLEIRQGVQIAYNNVRILERKLPALAQHQAASEKVKLAYKDQFDIGERTLLDVLDAENEAFQSSRAYINAEYERMNNVLAMLAEMGGLLEALSITNEQYPTLSELTESPLTADSEHLCPKVDVASQMSRKSFLAEKNKRNNAYKSIKIDTTLPAAGLSSNAAVINADDDSDGIANDKDQCPATPFATEVDAQGCTKYTADTRSVEIGIPFAFDSDVVMPQYYAEIERLATFLKQHPDKTVEIHGHASLDGEPQYNKRLSERRAFAVTEILINNFGISAQRVTAMGFGIEQPIQQEISVRANALNRRIEAKINS